MRLSRLPPETEIAVVEAYGNVDAEELVAVNDAADAVTVVVALESVSGGAT